MRNLYKLTLLFIFIFCLSLSLLPNNTSASTTGTVNATSLNVRSNATLTATIIGTLKKNAPVSITKTGKEWHEIKLNNKKGFVMAKYVTTKTLNPIPNPVPVPTTSISMLNAGKTGIVTITPLNVRIDASPSSRLLGTLYKGKKITITINKNGWYGFLYNGQTAYVSANYIFVGDQLPISFGEIDPIIALATSVETVPVYDQIDETSKLLGSIDSINSINIVEKLDNDNWYRIQFEDTYGFIQASAVDISEEIQKNMLSGKIIMLDAGHGGSDPGALGNGLVEKNVTLDVVSRLKQKLELAGATVLLTRSGDTFPSLQARAKQSTKSSADIFVSVHANKAAASTGNGIEVYYYTGSSATKTNSSKLAAAVQKHLVASSGLKNRGVKTANFYVIKYNNKPGILAEIGFLSGDEDSLVLRSNEGKESLADGLYLGINEYFARK